VPIIIVGFIQGTDGKYRFVIGVPIIIVGFIQGTDGKYRFVIGVPIIIVGFIQGTDGKYALGASSALTQFPNGAQRFFNDDPHFFCLATSCYRLQRHQRAIYSTKRRSRQLWDARKNVYLSSLWS